mmetsp:Transcript_15860/g.19665  ORF Transcript_15860/g.19665 Transcript_15860/m.19665 type:complete len:277 (-) Transcript_15860:889-1719(-)|eukprot:CAMPEP_0204860274 /NCGR_PEP_ID=MMETSP1347-20130617/24212_1 /ASSEMBLY_ACC=CAM_ASM_000690 /TAXON_ID=215587 /ORGANISM="Aplanochytrium stocchinoi, Strain GSBS06" /LENGTH=276 /DNA_ID=CAMNT_0052008945 /DNA_START=242 /DNA_END=1072 /DNA_ORIENTATION=-
MMPLRKLSFFLALGLILLLLCLMLPVQVASQELEELDLSSKENGKLRGGMVGSTEELEHSSSIADGLSSSFAMIMVSELGDETFIIAAIMAMRHSRQIVLAGALSALYIMTVLSTALGYIVPNLIDKSTAANLATGLYIFFGFRLFYIAYYADESETEEEIEEVEEKLKAGKKKTGIRAVCANLLTPLFLEAFLLTFSAEWGDRSQIATIALAAHKNPYAVTVGACVGHTICTSIAVWGGRLVATQISQRTVAICGGITFFAFAIWNVMIGFDQGD